MNDVNKEFATYLKSKSFKRLMDSLKLKYIKLSRFSGTIILKNLSKEEAFDIGNLLGKKLFYNDEVKISFNEINKKVKQGKFAEFNWIDTFTYYYNENIITKEEQKNINKLEEEEFYNNLLKDYYNEPYISVILDMFKNDDNIKKIIKSKYNKNKKNLRKEIDNIILLLNNIPDNPTYLPVYASKTGNPHYLDFNKNTSGLFLKILAKLKHYESIDKIDEKIKLLEQINVSNDPISNFVITYKLIGNNILNELSINNQIINMNLYNIKDLDYITTENKKVFIFENPSILLTLKDLNVPIIITSGMPNLAFHSLLEKLLDSGNKLYYNGDFDPEGLLIADNLQKKYNNIKLFCYSKKDYEKALSKEKINSSRMKKLDKVSCNELQEIKDILKKTSLSGYQEQNINNIKEHILSIIKN